jgi:RHS repeat-associated protein
MLKVDKITKKLEVGTKSTSLLAKVEFKKLVGKLMLAMMMWQAVAQPALALSKNGEGESKKVEKDASVATPPVQNPGDLVIVKHAPSINGSRVEGTVRVLLAESVNLNSNAVVTGDLLIPGSPRINLNSNVTYNGTVIGTGSADPTTHNINLNSNVTLRHVVTRTDAITISPVANPPQPTGTRDISLSRNDSPGDFSTVRNITLNSNYGTLTVPPGTYGNLITNSNSTFVMGVTGQSTTYNVQSINLNSNSGMQIQGAVTINVEGNVSLNSQTNMGIAASPISLSLNIAQGGLTLNSNTNFYGVVKAPSGQVNLNANSLLKGLVTCDSFNANSNSRIQPLVVDTNRPVVTIEEPLNGATFNQAQVKVSGTVADESVVSVKVNNVNATFNGATYSAVVPLNTGNNTITVVATDAFNNTGQASVIVSRGDGTNQPPVVNAGNDLNVSLPAQATLTGTVTDDGNPNPPGQVTITWSKVSGPGTVTFSSPSTAITNASFSTAGIYVLELKASDGQLSSSDRVAVTVTNNQTNQAPVVNAGADQTITLPAIASLNGTVTDDGLPSNQLVVDWSKLSGAGVITFTNPTAATTTASFSAAGVYVLRLTAGDGQLSSSDDVQVTVQAPAARFDILATPTSVTTVQNSTATYMINVTSNDPNFRQLVSLSISTLPGTARATFNPQQVVAGSASTLTIDLNNSGVSAGTYNLTVTASASIGGLTESHSANITLVVQAVGTTTLSGRVLSSEDDPRPIPGVSVAADGQSTTTDAAGAFLLSNVTAGNNRAILVDGRTASTPGTTYPVIAEPVDIVAGQPNQMAYTFYLPRIDTQYEVTVIPNQNTTVTTPRVNGLSTLIAANSNLRNRDGSAVTRVSMTPVAIDRTPAPLPSNLATTLVYTNQPGGAIADVAMPVTYPNLAGADPGALIPLYTFNHDTVTWVQYGVGKVSLDGRTIVPEIDPATNKPYGLRDFSWHFPAAGVKGSPTGTCSKNRTSNPVALSTGVKEEIMTDIAFGGARGAISLTRIYTSDLAVTGEIGQFGRGIRSNWEVKVSGSLIQGGAARVTWPIDIEGQLFNYTRTETDGTLVFTTTARTNLLGDELKKLTNGNIEYRSKNGDVMKFDSTGRMTGIVERNLNTTTLTYSGNNLVRVTDPVGRSINIVYDAQGRIISATDPINRTWTYSYDGSGMLATATDPLGNSMRYAYLIAGRLETVTDKRGNVIKRIAYANNRVISQTFADGGVERYDYTFAGSVISSVKITDPENRVTVKRFNAIGYVTFELDGLGQPSVISRDLNNNLETQVNGPCGCAEDIKTYDSKGNVLTMTDRLGQIMRYEYDPIFSFVTKITDKNGHITRFTYDSKGNRISVINAKNEITTMAYDQFGQQTSMTDALNHTWSMGYDPQGNVTSKSDPLNNTSTMTYDGIGRMLSMADPLNRTSSMVYDAMSRVISTTDSANATTTFTFDQNGNQTAMTNALNNTWTMAYDSKNRMISQKYPLTPSDNGVQRQMQLQYNLRDELVKLISPSGRISSFTYDSRGQRKTATDPLGAVVNYNYDINYNLLFLSDQRNNTTTYDYDNLYRIIKTTDPQGKITTASYDSEGNVITMVDRLGRNTTINYDELDRPLKVTYIDAVVTYQYDPAGRKTRVDDTQFGGSFIAWSYDNANRLLSETTNQGVVSYIYNAASQTALMKAADRPTINYSYDNAGRLSTIAQNLGQGLETFTYNYDILSRRDSLNFPNGVVTTYSYDENNRLVKLKYQKETNPAIEDFQYSYNAESEMASIASLFSTPLLPSTQNNAIADATNRISTFGTNSHSFNSVGEVTSKISASQTTLYNWDHRGRLTTVSLPDGQEINYTYDAINRKTSHSYQGNNTKFLYDGQEIVLDLTSNNTKVDYLHGGQLDEVLRQNKATETLYFHKNNIRSTIALSDINGSVIERTQYGVFGDSNNTSITRYGYAGREKDSVTSLIYYRARWYDPVEGRFLREDPIEFRGGLNLYAYANNNPILYIDPQGLSCQNSSCDFYCDEGVRKQMQKAWSRAQLGQARPEFSFCVFRFPDCAFGVSEIKSSNDDKKNKVSVPINCPIIIHTHPKGGGENPSDNDATGANEKDVDDISEAERKKKIICVISIGGFSCYYPNSLPYEHPDKGKIIKHRDSDFSAPCDKKPPLNKFIQKITKGDLLIH